MKFLVLVETEDYLDIEAENEEEARDKAIAEAQSHGLHEWTATIMHHNADVEIDSDIPY